MSLKPLAVLSALLLATPTYCSAQAAEPEWHPDLASAQLRAAETGRPLFVVFRCVR